MGDNTNLAQYWVDEETPYIPEDTAKKLISNAEKAYGACHNCYGKGYSTFNDRRVGTDTDTDIGSPGGYIAVGNANAMKFCACDRGKQLENLIDKQVKFTVRSELISEATRNRDGLKDRGAFTGRWMYDYFDSRIKELIRDEKDGR